MEIQSLLFSKLPRDIVNKNIYWKLCKLKAISSNLKYEIILFHSIYDIFKLYENTKYESVYFESNFLNNESYWLLRLLNDISWFNMMVLNLRYNGLCVKSEIYSYIFNIWSTMNNLKKKKFIEWVNS